MINNILNSLEGIKTLKDGHRWLSFCPCHDGRSRKLYITLGKNNVVLLFCQSCGAKGPDVCKAIGLPISEIMGENDFKSDSSYITAATQKQYELDCHLCLIYENKEDKNSIKDHRQYKKSKARIDYTKEKYPHIKMFEPERKNYMSIICDEIDSQVNTRDKFATPVHRENRELEIHLDGTFTLQDIDNLRRIIYENKVKYNI